MPENIPLDSVEKKNPSALPRVDFPYDKIDHSEDDFSPEEAREIINVILGSALASVFRHIIGDQQKLKAASIGRRAAAIIHEIRPDLVSNRSLRCIAKDLETSRQYLSMVSVDFRSQVGRLSSVGNSDQIRGACRERARAVAAGTYQRHQPTTLTHLRSSFPYKHRLKQLPQSVNTNTIVND